MECTGQNQGRQRKHIIQPSQVSALIPRPAFNGMERMCQRHGSNQNSHPPVLVRKPLCNQFIHYHISSNNNITNISLHPQKPTVSQIIELKILRYRGNPRVTAYRNFNSTSEKNINVLFGTCGSYFGKICRINYSLFSLVLLQSK